MSLIRRIPLRQMSVFSDLLQSTWQSVKSVCKYEQVDVVCDSYVDSSIKKCDRQRRCSCEPLELLCFREDIKVPVQFDRFRASPKNKEMLQALIIEYMTYNTMEENVTVVMSAYVESGGAIIDCTQIHNNERSVRNELNSTTEEADLRMMPHIYHAVLHGIKRAVVVSNDTDVLALIFFYMPRLQYIGLMEM